MVLRRLQISDLPFLLGVRNDNSTRQYLENDSIFSLEESQNWYLTSKPEWYIIEVDNEPVGYIRTNNDEVGVDIHPTHRRKGYAKRAYQLYLEGKQYASLWVFNDNFAKNLYLDLGFKENGNTKEVRGRKYIQMEYHS